MKILKALISLSKWEVLGCLFATINFAGGVALGYGLGKMIKKEKEEE